MAHRRSVVKPLARSDVATVVAREAANGNRTAKRIAAILVKKKGNTK